MHRLLPVLLLGLVLLLPTAAQADSIVYTKGDDVWLAKPDGSSARRVTQAGGFQSPTQSNDGTILAQRGTRFLRLDRSGHVLATIDSVMTGLPMGISAVGPFDPVISPDGTKLAYWIGMYSSWHDYRNNIDWNSTGSITVWQDARSGKFLGATHYYEEPSWLPDSSGALLFDEANALTAQVVAAGVGVDHNHIKQWFNDCDVKPANEELCKPISSGEITTKMDRLALLRGGTNSGDGGMAEGPGNTIATYAVHLPGLPVMECHFTGATGGQFGRPSWSPRGDALTWQEGDGIWTSTIGHDCSGSPRLTIPGGREPDWGPADVTTSVPSRPTTPAAPRITTPRSIGRRAVLRIAIACGGPCRASATARQGGRRVARAAKRLAGGSGKLALRPRRLRGRKSLSVRVTVRPDGGGATTVARTVRLRK